MLQTTTHAQKKLQYIYGCPNVLNINATNVNAEPNTPFKAAMHNNQTSESHLPSCVSRLQSLTQCICEFYLEGKGEGTDGESWTFSPKLRSKSSAFLLIPSLLSFSQK